MPLIFVLPPVILPFICTGQQPSFLIDNASAPKSLNALSKGCMGLVLNDSSPSNFTSESHKAATIAVINLKDVPELAMSKVVCGFLGL